MNQQRPYIVCHMIASLDGRIDCDMTEKIESGNEYYEALETLRCPAMLMGRVTMEMHYAKPGYNSPSDLTPIGVESFNKAVDADNYIVVVDTMARLAWSSNEFDGQPLLVVVSEDAPAETLRGLTEQGISWIATGKGSIDLRRAMELLAGEFGVKRLAVTGGGHVNASFLAAGLLDEISMMYAAGIDGRAGMAAAFDGLPCDTEPFRLSLQSVTKLGDNTIWVRYGIN